MPNQLGPGTDKSPLARLGDDSDDRLSQHAGARKLSRFSMFGKCSVGHFRYTRYIAATTDAPSFTVIVYARVGSAR